MIFGHEGYVGIGSELPPVKPAEVVFGGDDADIGASLGDEADDCLARTLGGVDVDARRGQEERSSTIGRSARFSLSMAIPIVFKTGRLCYNLFRCGMDRKVLRRPFVGKGNFSDRRLPVGAIS